MEGRSCCKGLHYIVAYIRLGKICTWRDVLERKGCLLSDVVGGSQDSLSRFSIFFGFSNHDSAPSSRYKRPYKSTCSPDSSLYTRHLTIQQLQSPNWFIPVPLRPSMKLLHYIVAMCILGRTCVRRDVLEVKDCNPGDVIGGLQDVSTSFTGFTSFSSFSTCTPHNHSQIHTWEAL